MTRDQEVYLDDLRDCIKLIEEYTRGVSYEEFSEDTEMQDAVIRRFEVIGEVVKNISDEFKAQHEHIPWRKVAGLRDVLIHGYFDVNLERLWLIIEKDLPDLKAALF